MHMHITLVYTCVSYTRKSWQHSETLQRQYLKDYSVDVETMKSTRGTGIRQDSVGVSTLDAVGALK
jgi:hypothetical protein